MRIKVKEDINFLKEPFYDIIAIDARGNELYLIQEDNNEFTWIESQYFDKRTIENSESLIIETLSEYTYQRVPVFMTKDKRKIGNGKYWRINSNEFCDYISLHQTFWNQGYTINREIENIVNDESIQFRIIEQQINQTGKTIILLGDGYFPSIVSIHRTTKNNTKENIHQNFRLDFHQMRTDQNVETSMVADLDGCLDELFDWSYQYVKGFAKYPKMFDDKYWNVQILDMIYTSKANLLVYSKLNDSKATRYFLPQADGTEINLLELENENSKATLRIQNVVH